jgi:hypothetical protein
MTSKALPALPSKTVHVAGINSAAILGPRMNQGNTASRTQGDAGPDGAGTLENKATLCFKGEFDLVKEPAPSGRCEKMDYVVSIEREGVDYCPKVTVAKTNRVGSVSTKAVLLPRH